MKTHIAWVLACLLLVMLTGFFTNGQQTYKIEKLKDKNEVLTEKIKELNHIDSTSSASENKAFFEALFNYSDIDKRQLRSIQLKKDLTMHSLLVLIKSTQSVCKVNYYH